MGLLHQVKGNHNANNAQLDTHVTMLLLLLMTYVQRADIVLKEVLMVKFVVLVLITKHLRDFQTKINANNVLLVVIVLMGQYQRNVNLDIIAYLAQLLLFLLIKYMGHYALLVVIAQKEHKHLLIVLKEDLEKTLEEDRKAIAQVALLAIIVFLQIPNLKYALLVIHVLKVLTVLNHVLADNIIHLKGCKIMMIVKYVQEVICVIKKQFQI